MRTRLLLATLISVLVGGAGTAFGAEPSSGSLDPVNTSSSWTGSALKTDEPVDPSACDRHSDQNDLCDHFDLTVGVEPSYWESRDGSVSIGIGWRYPDDDLDLYVYGSAGDLVASSTTEGGTTEQVFLEEPAGTFEVRVVPVSVEHGGYAGWASFSSQEADPAETDGTQSGEVGSGGGGGSGGGDSGPEAPASSGKGSTVAVGPGPDLRPAGLGGLTFSDPPFAARTFDARAETPPSSFELRAGTSANEQEAPVRRSPAAGSKPLRAATTAATIGRFPESVWMVLVLGTLATALTALAVFDRLPGAPDDPARRRRPWASTVSSRSSTVAMHTQRLGILWWA